MRILKEGDKSQAVCLHCKRLVNTTYHYDTYVFPNDEENSIENVLQGFCDVCGSVAAIPAQSSPKIHKEQRRNNLPVEARVTPPLEDILFAVSAKIRVEPQLTLRILIHFFTQQWLQKPVPVSLEKIINSHLGLRLSQGLSTCRVSSKVDSITLEILDRVQEKFHVTRSDLFKAVLIEAGMDLVERPDSAIAKRFFKAASILGPIDEKPLATSSK